METFQLGSQPYFSKRANYLPKHKTDENFVKKEMKILNYTENAEYPPVAGQFSLALIDKKDSTCESRLSKDDHLANKYRYFRSCLEEVGNYFEEDGKSLVHCHDNNIQSTNNIREFLKIIETKLNLDKKSEVFQTTNNSITAIRVAPFWLKNTLRRRFYLILVREGKWFDQNIGIDSISNNYNCYCSKIKPFLNLFLEGYTRFSDICLHKVYHNFHHGIIYQFKNLTEDQIKDVLMFKENE